MKSDTKSEEVTKALKTIALIDPFPGGHHSIYFKTITQTALELGYHVLAFCPEPQALNTWLNDNLPGHESKIDLFEIHEPLQKKPFYANLPLLNKFNKAAHVLDHWRDAARSIDSAAAIVGKFPDRVFFLWIDSYLNSYLPHPFVDRIFPYNWSGLYFQPSHFRERQPLSLLTRGLVKRHAMFHSPYCQSVAILDEGVAGALQAAIPAKPVIVFPDFADASKPDMSFELVSEIQAKAKGRKIIGLLGALGRHKGFLTMLRLSQAAIEDDWFFLFAGQLSKLSFSDAELTEIETTIQAEPHNCLFHLQRIPDEPQFNAVIATCDVLFTLYDYRYSSNTLTKAAIFEKPVIASDRFCIGERVQRYQLGATASPDSLADSLLALRTLDRQFSSATPTTFGFAEYRRLHSTAQLRVQLKALLADS